MAVNPKSSHNRFKFLANHPAPANGVIEASAEFNVEDYKHEGTAYRTKYNAPSDVTSTIGVVYFPGWELRLDGQRQPKRISMSAIGLVNVQLPAGSHTAELKYTISPIGRTARILKLSCLGCVAVDGYPAGVPMVEKTPPKSFVFPSNRRFMIFSFYDLRFAAHPAC